VRRVPQGARRFVKIKLTKGGKVELNKIRWLWECWDHDGEECSGCAKRYSRRTILFSPIKNVSLPIKRLREL
jgi:hypothetical protein